MSDVRDILNIRTVPKSEVENILTAAASSTAASTQKRKKVRKPRPFLHCGL
jgi:hypothetical protein